MALVLRQNQFYSIGPWQGIGISFLTSNNSNSLFHHCCEYAKPRVSLTAPNHDHFARVSLMVLDNFLDAITKAKKLIRKYIAQNLKQVSLKKGCLALAMVFNLLLSNPT